MRLWPLRNKRQGVTRGMGGEQVKKAILSTQQALFPSGRTLLSAVSFPVSVISFV